MDDSYMEKSLYIISGCNGAGKTTASYTVLPEVLHCREFVNADEIARGLSPFNPEGVAVAAGRLMLQRIEELLNGNDSFAIETTLSTRSYLHLVRRAKEKGFSVKLVFFWLRTPELAIERVAERVRKGGHNIPVDIIRRRYSAGLRNLFELYIPEVDDIYDNSQSLRLHIASGAIGEASEIYHQESYESLKDYVK